MNIECSSGRPDRIGCSPISGRDLGRRVNDDDVRIEVTPHVDKTAVDVAVETTVSPLGLFCSGV